MLAQEAAIVGFAQVTESYQHSIEFGREQSDLIFRRDVDVLIEVTLSYSLGLLGQHRDRTYDQSRKSPGEQERKYEPQGCNYRGGYVGSKGLGLRAHAGGDHRLLIQM